MTTAFSTKMASSKSKEDKEAKVLKVANRINLHLQNLIAMMNSATLQECTSTPREPTITITKIRYKLSIWTEMTTFLKQNFAVTEIMLKVDLQNHLRAMI